MPDCLPWGFLAECGPKGVQGGERKATLLASIDDNFAVSNSPLAGIDAPTPAREKGLQPYGALTLFFRWRKKSVQKKASGTATPGKSPLLPILAAGLAMSRAAELASYACYRARSCSPFSAVKMSGPFSLRCLSPPCPGAVGGGHTQPLQGGMLWRSLCFFARQKASGKSNPRWPCLRAMRPVAEWRSLLCSWRESAPDPRAGEALRRAAVERSQSAFLRALCAHSAQSGVKGHCPLREPRGPPPSGGKTPAKLHVALRPCAHNAQRWVQGFSPAGGCG